MVESQTFFYNVMSNEFCFLNYKGILLFTFWNLHYFSLPNAKNLFRLLEVTDAYVCGFFAIRAKSS